MKQVLTAVIGLFSLLGFSQELDLEWGKHFGGNQNEFPKGSVIDALGNFYTIGTFQNEVDFDPGPQEFILDSSGNGDIFISKLAPDGSFIWAGQFKGNYGKVARAIEVDANGNIYITGEFEGTVDFDPNVTVENMTSNGWYDIFIVKLDSDGSLIWNKQFGGSSADRGYAIDIDATGNVYTTGTYLGLVDFDPNTGTYMLPSEDQDVFVSKLDPDGNFIWAKRLGGSQIDSGIGIKVDDVGDVWTVGQFRGIADFNPSSNDFLLESIGGEDIFISKLRSDGLFIFAKQIGGSNIQHTEDILFDTQNNLLISGYFSGSTDFNPGSDTFSLTAGGSVDAFICKLDIDGEFVWAIQFQGPLNEFVNGITTDNTGAVYATGSFNSRIDLDPGSGTFELETLSQSSGYIAKLNEEGNFVWGKQIVIDNIGGGISIQVNEEKDVFVSGLFFYTVYLDSNVSFSTNGLRDVFIQKLRQTTLGILESSENSSVTFYPNPTREYILMKFAKAGVTLVSIYNNTGQLLSSNQFRHDTQLKVHINGPSGIYLVKIKQDDGATSQIKVIKY
jgi:hypothetical protein